MARQKRDENVVKLANELLKSNTINNAQDLQDVLRDVMGSVIETMLEGELTDHLDYEKYQNSNGTSDRRMVQVVRKSDQHMEKYK